MQLIIINSFPIWPQEWKYTIADDTVHAVRED